MKNRNLFGILVVLEITTVVFLGIVVPHVLMPDNDLFFQVFGTAAIMVVYYAIRLTLIKRWMAEAMTTLEVKDKEKLSVGRLIDYLKEVLDTAMKKISNYEKVNQTLRLAIDVNNALLATNDNTEMYEIVLRKAMEAIVRCDKGSVMILNEEDQLEFVALHGFDESFYDLRIPKKYRRICSLARWVTSGWKRRHR